MSAKERTSIIVAELSRYGFANEHVLPALEIIAEISDDLTNGRDRNMVKLKIGQAIASLQSVSESL